MFTLIPVFPAATETAWSSEDGRVLTTEFLRRVQALELCGPTHLVTDQEALLPCAPAGMDRTLVPSPAALEDDPWAPPGTLEALRLLETRLGGLPDELLVLDRRAPLLLPQDVSAAAELLKDPGVEAAVGLEFLRDHPSQYKLFLRAMDFGTLHMLEDGPPPLPEGLADGLVLTKPFDFDWEAKGVAPEMAGFFAPVPQNPDLQITPCPPPASAGDCPLFWRAGPARARLILAPPDQPRPRAGERLCGLGFNAAADGSLLLFRDESARTLRLALDPRTCGRFRRRLRFQFFPGRERDAAMDELAIEGSAASIPWALPDTDVAGLTYQLLAEVEDAGYHLAEPFPVVQGPWAYEPENLRTVDPVHRGLLSGRQLLPPVYRPARSLLACRTRHILEHWAGVRPEQIRGVPCCDEQRILVDSPIDLVRCRMLLDEARP